MAETLIQKIAAIKELPTLPEVVLQAQELLNSSHGDAQKLSRIVEQDPTLASKLLKVANSSYFAIGISNRISSIAAAITRIGFNEVSNILTAMSLMKKFSVTSEIFDYRAFWRHSLTAAYLCEHFAQIPGTVFNEKEKHILFLSGLFHDVGILISNQFFHTEFSTILGLAMDQEISFLNAEHTVIGKDDHAAIGSALLEIWKLDSRIVNSVRFHHNPKNSSLAHKKFAYACYLAEYILCNSSIGTFEGTFFNEESSLKEVLGLGSESFEVLFHKAEEQVLKSEMLLAFGMGAESDELRKI